MRIFRFFPLFLLFVLSFFLQGILLADDSSVSTTLSSTTTSTHHDDGSITTQTMSSDGSSVIRVDKPEGITITTVIKSDTSFTKTTDNPDGSSIQTINHADGSALTSKINIDGSWVVTTIPKEGTPTVVTSASSATNNNSSPSGQDSPSPTPSPSPTSSPEDLPEAAPFCELKAPFEMKLIPVYDNKEEKGKAGASFFYLSESCISGNMYQACLNAVATSGDPDQLYRPEMAELPPGEMNLKDNTRKPSPNVAQIKKVTKSDGTFSYELINPQEEVKVEVSGRVYKVRRGELPITHINLAMAAFFCNWMHNGQRIAPEGPGNTRDGAYLVDNGYDAFFSNQPASLKDRYLSLLTGIIQQPGARWVIPDIKFYQGYDTSENGSAHHHSGLYENYGMFYSQTELWEWTSTRARPETNNDSLYHRDHNLTGPYFQVSGVQPPREKYAIQYQYDKVSKRPGENAQPADPPPNNEDGVVSFRLMKMTN